MIWILLLFNIRITLVTSLVRTWNSILALPMEANQFISEYVIFNISFNANFIHGFYKKNWWIPVAIISVIQFVFLIAPDLVICCAVKVVLWPKISWIFIWIPRLAFAVTRKLMEYFLSSLEAHKDEPLTCAHIARFLFFPFKDFLIE